MAHKCTLCEYTTEKESELMEHMLTAHAASADKFMS